MKVGRKKKKKNAMYKKEFWQMISLGEYKRSVIERMANYLCVLPGNLDCVFMTK